MDRQTVWAGQIPLETDLLNTNRNVMIGLAKLSLAALGNTGIVNGLAVTPTIPASLNVNVGAGEVYQPSAVDATAYSSLPEDTTDTIIKQGLLLPANAPVVVACTPPSTAGYSINYLIEVQLQENDINDIVLPFYNAANPQSAWSGPNNSGNASSTTRADQVGVQAKPGAAAPTGTQVTPSPDTGWIGVAVVTVANGQATITSGNITQLTGSHVLNGSLLSQIQSAVTLTNAISYFSTPAGSMRNGAMAVGSAASTATFTADQVIVAAALNGQPYLLANYNQTVNLASTGAGGMDTGSAPISGYVALYAIYNPITGLASILATNAATVAPTIYGGANMPAGYTASALISVWPTNASRQFVIGIQNDRKISLQNTVAHSGTSLPTSVTALSLATIVPLNAKSVFGFSGVASTTVAGTYSIYVYSSSSQINFNNFTGYSPVGASAGCNFAVDLAVPQTLYYNGQIGTGTTFQVEIGGYTF